MQVSQTILDLQVAHGETQVLHFLSEESGYVPLIH